MSPTKPIDTNRANRAITSLFYNEQFNPHTNEAAYDSLITLREFVGKVERQQQQATKPKSKFMRRAAQILFALVAVPIVCWSCNHAANGQEPRIVKPSYLVEPVYRSPVDRSRGQLGDATSPRVSSQPAVPASQLGSSSFHSGRVPAASSLPTVAASQWGTSTGHSFDVRTFTPAARFDTEPHTAAEARRRANELSRTAFANRWAAIRMRLHAWGLFLHARTLPPRR